MEKDYDYGQSVELTAIPDENNHFVQWTGDLTGSTNPETLVMNGDKTVGAEFAVDQVTLTVNITGNGDVTLVPPGT